MQDDAEDNAAMAFQKSLPAAWVMTLIPAGALQRRKRNASV